MFPPSLIPEAVDSELEYILNSDNTSSIWWYNSGVNNYVNWDSPSVPLLTGTKIRSFNGGIVAYGTNATSAWVRYFKNNNGALE